MWSGIFENNSENVISVLDTYIDKLNDFKTAINESNLNKMNELIQKANQIKKIL